jgi:hypothetical protein
MGPQLDLDLVEPPLVIARLDIDDAELVGETLPLVIRVEDLHRGHRRGQLGAQHGVEKVDQPPAVVLRAQQGLEHPVDLGVDGVAHTDSLAQPSQPTFQHRI